MKDIRNVGLLTNSASSVEFELWPFEFGVVRG